MAKKKTVKVKLLTPRAANRCEQRIGQIIEVEPDEAKRMIEAKQAVPADDKRENATSEASESR